MSDRMMFPCAYPNWQEKRIDTTFWRYFEIAEAFGFHAIKDTYKRSFESWKNNIKYLTELCSVMNHKCWDWNGVNDEICQFYTDRYHDICDYAYGTEGVKSPFTDDELQFFSMVLD